MRRIAALFLLVLPLAVPAQTLRWASQGDPMTMDPHSQNEGLTNTVNGQVYERLTRRDRALRIVPSLATEWSQTGPTTWRFKLRPGVKFHDGAPFGAEDVVFSVNRAKDEAGTFSVYGKALGTPVAIDPLTVEFRLDRVNPVFLEQLDLIFVMNKAWAEKHKVQKPLNFKAKEESYASFAANGTGPYQLVKREPGIRTSFKRFAGWWGKPEGNVQEIVYLPIANDATRLAALLSGEIDFVLDPAPRDIARLRNTAGVKIVEGPENRIVFIGMDQQRDELLHGSVKDRNPFKDVRVREAFMLAIDAEAIKANTMRGQSVPTACLAPAAIGCLAPELERRPAADPAKAKALLAAAGYPEGFELTLDCPNDRYVNDQAICLAAAAMLGKVGVKVKVDARPKSIYFQKIERHDTSFYLLGWGGGTTDAQGTLDPIAHRPDAASKKGEYNYGGSGDAELDRLLDAAGTDMNAERRARLIGDAQRRVMQQFYLLPLHRQMITWVGRRNVAPVVMPDNGVRAQWMRID